jgi:hypothetical protein
MHITKPTLAADPMKTQRAMGRSDDRAIVTALFDGRMGRTY